MGYRRLNNPSASQLKVFVSGSLLEATCTGLSFALLLLWNVCACADANCIKLRPHTCRPYPSLQAAGCLKLRFYTVRNGTTFSLCLNAVIIPCLSLRTRLGGLPRECKALCASHSQMHLHDYHVCAHGRTVSTNPERSESASFTPSR